MPNLSSRHIPALDLGLTAVVLGAVGLALFALPILGIPISGGGLIMGLLGVIHALRLRSSKARLAWAGVVVCGVALGLDFAFALAPAGYGTAPEDPGVMAPLPLRPYIAPPAPYRGGAIADHPSSPI